MRRNRADLIDELVAVLESTLANRSDNELETLLETLSSGAAAFGSHPRNGLATANNEALVMLDPKASKEDVLNALQELVDQLELNWDLVENQIRISPSFIADRMYGDKALLN
jgi:hypothetical protein